MTSVTRVLKMFQETETCPPTNQSHLDAELAVAGLARDAVANDVLKAVVIGLSAPEGVTGSSHDLQVPWNHQRADDVSLGVEHVPRSISGRGEQLEPGRGVAATKYPQ